MLNSLFGTLNTVVLPIVLALCAIFPVNAKEEIPNGKVYTFAVVPQQSARKLVRTWTPILRKIAAESGVKLRFITAKDISTYGENVMLGKYDFAYVNPLQYVTSYQQSKYHAFAKAKNKNIMGIIVARKDRFLRGISDLKHQRLAFPSPDAFGASILVRAELQEHAIPITPSYVLTHDSVYRNVAAGVVDAGGGVMRTFSLLDPAIKEKLYVVYTTRGYTPHALVYKNGMPKHITDLVAKAILRLDQTDEGKELLKALNIEGFEQAEDSEWDDIRKLKLSDLLL